MERMNRRWACISQEEIEALAARITAEDCTSDWMTSPDDPAAGDCLEGRSLTLCLDGGSVMTCAFSGGGTLSWTWNGEQRSPCRYRAACAPGNPDVVFIHYYCSGERVPKCMELVLDLTSGYCTVVAAQLGQVPENPREVTRTIYFGEIASQPHPAEAEKHRYTTDLVGRAICWEMPAFTKKPPIKHIYLSPKYYGIFMTRGDACFMSADPAEYIRIRQGLYLVTVVEERRSGIQLSFLINTDLVEDVVGHFGISMGNEENEDTPRIACTVMTGRKGRFVPMETVF